MARKKWHLLEFHATARYPVIPSTSSALLTRTSKMPSRSWGIPALGAVSKDGPIRTCPSAVLGHNALADEHKEFVPTKDGRYVCIACYPRAKESHYRIAAAKACHIKRLDWTLDCLKTPEGARFWAEYMTEATIWAAREKDTGVVRVHDQGDFFSATYARAWLHVAEQVLMREPDISLWFATRSHYRRGNLSRENVAEYEEIMHAVRAIDALPNCVVRPSAMLVVYGDEESLIEGLHTPPKVIGLSAGTMVVLEGLEAPAGVHLCPSHDQEGMCLGAKVGGIDCLTCWDGSIEVAYRGSGDLKHVVPKVPLKEGLTKEAVRV